MSRYLESSLESDESLDSFLDIITNVIGVLVLIACSIALQLRNYEPPKAAPSLEKKPDGFTNAYFDCSKGQCAAIEYPKDTYQRIIAEAYDHNNGSISWDFLVEFCNDRSDSWHPTHAMTMTRSERQVVQLQVEMKVRSSQTGTIDLQKLIKAAGDPSDTTIYFFVHADSFDEFRNAREIARSLGFRVGWRPVATNYIPYIMEDPLHVVDFWDESEIEAQ
ncbi:MAG: hypothetical protein R3C03_03975 [Pirellulaceae bacterium]